MVLRSKAKLRSPSSSTRREIPPEMRALPSPSGSKTLRIVHEQGAHVRREHRVGRIVEHFEVRVRARHDGERIGRLLELVLGQRVVHFRIAFDFFAERIVRKAGELRALQRTQQVIARRVVVERLRIAMTQHLAVGAEADRADRRRAAFGSGGNDARSAADVQRRDLRRAQAHASAWNVARAAGPERRAERNSGEVAVLHEHRIALGTRRIERDVAAVLGEVAAEHRVVLHGAPIALGRLAVLRRHFEAFEVVAQQEVHCAGDRVGAVHGRRATGDDLDALHQRRRNGRQVDAARAVGRE